MLCDPCLHCIITSTRKKPCSRLDGHCSSQAIESGPRENASTRDSGGILHRKIENLCQRKEQKRKKLKIKLLNQNVQRHFISSEDIEIFLDSVRPDAHVPIS